MTNFDEYKANRKKEEEKNASFEILKTLAEKKDIDYSELLEKLLSKEVLLDDVIKAIKDIPEQKDIDMSPVIKAIKEIEVKETVVNIPEQKPDKAVHKLLEGVIEELKKKVKKERLDKKDLQDSLKKLLGEIEDVKKQVESFTFEGSVSSGAGGGGGGESAGFLNVSESDRSQMDFWYYGGTDSSGTYKINRYTACGFRSQATGAWADRYLLIYS